MPSAVRSRFAWFVLLCAAVAVLAVIHRVKAASGSCSVKVLAADTLVCADGRLVRLIGVAPCGHTSDGTVTGAVDDPGRAYLAGLINAQAVRIKPVKASRDTRGCLYAYVYLGEVLVNGRMIKDGYALADPRRSYPEQELFRAYESEARLRGLGIWAAGREGSDKEEKTVRKPHQ